MTAERAVLSSFSELCGHPQAREDKRKSKKEKTKEANRSPRARDDADAVTKDDDVDVDEQSDDFADGEND